MSDAEVMLILIMFHDGGYKCLKHYYLNYECSGISYVDSTPLRVCREQRILQHKVFKGFAERGKCSMGWFYGFKLHLIINDRGELINFMITPGNVDDREPLKQHHFVEKIQGKLFGDILARIRKHISTKNVYLLYLLYLFGW